MCDDLPAFKGFRQKFTKDISEWQKLYDSREPHLAKLPAPWDTDLSEFQRIIVMRCIRPDKIVPLITDFVKAKLG